MKSKVVKGICSLRSKKFGLSSLFLVCTFFLAGLFGSSFFFQSPDDVYGARPRARLLDSTTEETEYNMLTSGESGDNSIASIPFQAFNILHYEIWQKCVFKPAE